MQMALNALSSDFSLNAEQPFALTMVVTNNTYYLTDQAGNRLTDPQGNYLTGKFADTTYIYSFRAMSSDLSLNAE